MNGPEVVAKSGPGAAPTVTPRPVAAVPVVAAPDPAIELKTQQEAFAQAQRVADIKMKRQADKLRSERETEKKTWGEKLSRLDRMEKLQANAKLNPRPFLEEMFGKDYYKTLTEYELSGGTPADIVASELAKMKDEFNGELSKRDAAAQKERDERTAEMQRQNAEITNQQVVGFIHDFWKANAKEYPAIEAEGHAPERIAAMIAAEVRKEFDATTEVDADGNITKRGTANPKGVADKWEASLLSRAKRINALPKYAAEVPKSAAQPLRRTLSNDLTGSTAADRPAAMTSEQLKQRALEARQKYIDGKAQR